MSDDANPPGHSPGGTDYIGIGSGLLLLLPGGCFLFFGLEFAYAGMPGVVVIWLVIAAALLVPAIWLLRGGNRPRS